MPAVTCPLCNEPILSNQSRVCVFGTSPSSAPWGAGDVRYVHRKCAAEKWPDRYENRPNPK